ncbi:related to DRS1-RNA helicase of the DEAD box family [Sporisorium scitamineum]|uniref:RNA helicase n=1 Tax=Sporisorium scitamineum TaxID=49012 RepID=A0A0F7S5B8_9BASI|nr:related to DRS1-RNA helicase of the DEAD box family [Sporisorium scitamineum]CDS02302.1 hypothetical protein [Sporisorium scitamineum]
MPAQHLKPSPAAAAAKRKANATPVSTPPQKKKSFVSKASPSKRSNDDDFIMTLDSDDDVEDLDAANADAAGDDDSESEPEQEQDAAPTDEKLTKNQRKRKEKAHLAGKEKIVESVAARAKPANGAAAKDGLALDKDFEFDIFGNGSAADYPGAEANGWDMSVTGTRMHKKLNVDDIIEKRRKTRPDLALPVDDDEDEETSEASGAEDTDDGLDDDIKNAEYADSEEEDEDLDAQDRFGGGNGKIVGEDEDEDDAAEVDSEEDPLSSDDDHDASEDDDQAAQAEQDEESNSSDDDSDSETEQEKAKKAAFFADEPVAATSSSSSKEADAEASFGSFSLSRPVLRALSSLSFHKPTPIQSRTIPIALAGKDIVAGAVTGSGKTAAFMIPSIERLTWRAKGRAQEAKSRVLILAPTRELAIQCYSVGKSIAKFTDIRFCLCVGGLSVKSQEAELKLRPEVVIATPGRLIDHVRNSASFTLDDIEILVMDEADRMLEDGFADELSEIVKSCPKGARQTMLFSATMTDDVEQLVRLSLKRPVRLFVDPKRTTAKKLIQEFVRVRGSGTGGVAGADGLAGVGNEPSTSAVSGKRSEDAQRPALLLALCTRTFTSQVIIFVRSKKLAHQLKIVFGLLGLSAGELHGDLSQEQRIDALTDFRDGKVDFLLATDLASRGLDIKGVQTVINYDMPGQFEAYLHRVGRTARAGRNGRAVTLVGEADRRMLKLAIKKSSAEQVKHRIIPSAVASKMLETLEQLKPEVDAVLREEKEEKALRIAEMELKKGENMATHADEIFSRPKRTWFQTSSDKDKASLVSKAQYEATMEAPAKKGKEGRDKYAGLSRKKRRSKMMREQIERERKEASTSGGAKTASGGSMDAGIRAAKKAQRPTKLGVAPVKVLNKGRRKKSGGGGGAKSGGAGGAGGKKIKSSFSRDFGDKKRR